MDQKPIRIAIINRSFWPIYPVIGEALLRFAESASNQKCSVSVIMQDHVGIKEKLKDAKRGSNIRFYPVKALTTSASGILMRALDTLFFMFWVLYTLIWIRPNKIYVSTDPPILVPFIVMLYCRILKAEFVYHLQDIHPEVTNVVVKINRLLYRILLKIDITTMRKAKCLITITEKMAYEIKKRSNTDADIYVLPNPAVSFDGIDTSSSKLDGFTFCGNAGRLQRIPLLLAAIAEYYKEGGSLKFVFAGGGVYQNLLEDMSEKYVDFEYLGILSSFEAAQISNNYTWALLPIEDEVTKYAFPSKSSSYVFSGAKILAVCGENTSVANWVNLNKLGLVIEPNVGALVDVFFEIENGLHLELQNSTARETLKSKLKFESFVDALKKIILN